MERGKLIALLALGVGLFALLARRAQAASAQLPGAWEQAPATWAPEYPGSTPGAPLAWPAWPSGGGTPAQPGAATPAYDDVWGAVDIWEGIPDWTPVGTGGGGYDWGAGGAVDIWEGIPDWTPELTGSGAVDIWEGIPDWQSPIPAPAPVPAYPPYRPPMTPDANVNAFLALIRRTEGTDPNPRGWSPYAVTYAYEFAITDFRKHPAALGWPGVRLPDQTCINAGFSPGCVTTAAGAYQFILPTWNANSGGSDFSAASQDAAAIRLLEKIGALQAIRYGDLNTALQLASSQWASLPFATVGQSKVTLADAQAIYQQAGGAISGGTTVATATVGIRG